MRNRAHSSLSKAPGTLLGVVAAAPQDLLDALLIRSPASDLADDAADDLDATAQLLQMDNNNKAQPNK